jgi:hypothetical protein
VVGVTGSTFRRMLMLVERRGASTERKEVTRFITLRPEDAVKAFIMLNPDKNHG